MESFSVEYKTSRVLSLSPVLTARGGGGAGLNSI